MQLYRKCCSALGYPAHHPAYLPRPPDAAFSLYLPGTVIIKSALKFQRHSISNRPSISNVHSISNQHPFSEQNSIIGTQFFKPALIFRWAHDFESATDFRRLCVRFWNDHRFYLNDFCMTFNNFTGIQF